MVSLARRRQPELPRSPGQRNLELAPLELTDARSAARNRQTRARGEESGNGRRERAGVGQHLPRLRSSFQPETGEPERDIEAPIADARMVPVDEQRVGLLEAEVVAPDVKMQQLVAVELHLSRGAQQLR